MTAGKHNQLLVSVIIPAYNCEAYLAEAIESVLSQTYPAAEVIIIDDGSTDKTAEVAKTFGSQVRYCYQTHGGIGTGRNRGAEMARGDLLASLDADDRWVTEKLALQVGVLQANPEIDMVFGQARQLRDGAEWERGITESQYDGPELMAGMVPGTMLIRKECFFRVGLFRTDLKVGEFIDWYTRAIEAGLTHLTLPNLMLWRRVHATNVGVRERQSVTDYARVLKASLDRRRAADPHSSDN